LSRVYQDEFKQKVRRHQYPRLWFTSHKGYKSHDNEA